MRRTSIPNKTQTREKMVIVKKGESTIRGPFQAKRNVFFKSIF
jgi:hypothetical protein